MGSETLAFLQSCGISNWRRLEINLNARHADYTRNWQPKDCNSVDLTDNEQHENRLRPSAGGPRSDPPNPTLNTAESSTPRLLPMTAP